MQLFVAGGKAEGVCDEEVEVADGNRYSTGTTARSVCLARGLLYARTHA